MLPHSLDLVRQRIGDCLMFVVENVEEYDGNVFCARDV